MDKVGFGEALWSKKLVRSSLTKPFVNFLVLVHFWAGPVSLKNTLMMKHMSGYGLWFIVIGEAQRGPKNQQKLFQCLDQRPELATLNQSSPSGLQVFMRCKFSMVELKNRKVSGNEIEE